MHARGQRVPGPAVLQATLCKITETLAKELSRPSGRAPAWSDFEWTVARAVAAMHGVSPLLSRVLPWSGPVAWSSFLEEQWAHTARRHARIEALQQSIDHGMHRQGIAATALKGAALHELGVYSAGDRPMADVDVLVRPQDAEQAAGVLRSLGFKETSRTWKERGFTPIDHHPADDLGEHADNDVKVELHQRICERLPWHVTDISERIFPAVARPGLNSYPSHAALMTHLLLHAAGSMAYQSLRLLQLHDIAMLAARMADADWQELADPAPEAGAARGGVARLPRRNPGRMRRPDFARARRPGAAGLWWAFPPLNLCARYYGSAIPAPVLARLGARCPRVLARACRGKGLYDVSFSYPWVDAFPGIEWSQSVRELIGYAISRVRPNAVHVAARARLAGTEPWLQHSAWQQLSQSRRILRWLTSRPSRPLTMHAVRCALARPQ